MKYSKVLVGCLLLFLLALAGCKEERKQAILPDASEQGNPELEFKFEKCIKLYDGEYFVNYCVQSNLESEIDVVLEQEPQIKVSPYNIEDYPATSGLESSHSEQSNLPTSEYDVSEVIDGGNIPRGYKVELYYKNNDLSGGVAFRSYANRYYTDSGALGIYVAHGGHTVPTYFDSKGCCWYSVGWYERGNRTIGPNNTHSHTFYTTTYTSYPGARARAYTTLTAWNSMTKSFLY